MKIYIMVDQEGISGISGKAYISSDLNRPDLIAKGRQFMADDINACIQGCVNANVTEIVVRDCHGDGFNISREMVASRADFISGNTPGTRFADFDGVDGLILLGYHAMAGTYGAILEHTMSSLSWQNVWLNGRKAGEAAIDAAIAAEHGVPVIMVSGDDKLCEECAAWIPGVVTCEVKKGFSCNGARMPAQEKVHALITAKTEEAVLKCASIAPLRLDYPVAYRVELVERRQLPCNSAYRIIDGRTYELETDSVEKALFFNW